MGYWQLYEQTATAVYSRQNSYADREKSFHLMTTGGHKDIPVSSLVIPEKFIDFNLAGEFINF